MMRRVEVQKPLWKHIRKQRISIQTERCSMPPLRGFVQFRIDPTNNLLNLPNLPLPLLSSPYLCGTPSTASSTTPSPSTLFPMFLSFFSPRLSVRIEKRIVLDLTPGQAWLENRRAFTSLQRGCKMRTQNFGSYRTGQPQLFSRCFPSFEFYLPCRG